MAYRTVVALTDSSGTVLARPVTEAELAKVIQNQVGLYRDVQATIQVIEYGSDTRGNITVRELCIELQLNQS